MPDALDTIHPQGLTSQVPYLEQYFGAWMMAEDHFRGLAKQLDGFDVHAHLMAAHASRGQGMASHSSAARTADGIAIISLHGVLMKHASSLSSATSTVATRRAIRQAAADEKVRGILLHIDSPGGTVAGTKDLAVDVAEAAKQKTVWAACDDLCASAAYWIASQASRISANEMALIGSIGTYGVVYDMSGAAAQQGVKVHVVRAGEFKGAFTPGTEVSDKQLATYQTLIDQMNDHFLRGVSAGRQLPMEAVRAIADGRAHLAKTAKGIGLIDAVESLDETLALLRSSLNSPRPTPVKVTTMSQATITELKAGCPGADNDFLVAQLEANATLEQARSAWMTEQNRRLSAAATRKPGNALPTSGANRVGVQPVNAGAVPHAGSYGGDAIADWDNRLQQLTDKGMTKAQATSKLCSSEPDLHQAYIAAYNELHRGRR